MKILVTGVGGPTPRSFALALKLYSNYSGWEFIGTDSNPLAMGLYRKDLFSNTYLVPPAGHSEYWQQINSIVKKESIEYAVVLPEKEVQLWSHASENGPLPCPAFLPDAKMADLLVDKSLMTKVLEPIGNVPASITFGHDLLDLNVPFDILGPAFWVRSAQGTSGLGSLLIQSPEALRNWMQINPGVSSFLASTYLPGRNLACKLLYYNGQLVRSACAERVNYIMAKVAPSGITGNTAFGRLINEPEIVTLADRNMQFLFSTLGVKPHGFFTMDLKEDSNGVPFITEINVRHVAFTQCFAAAGANFAEDTIKLLHNPADIDPAYRMYSFPPQTIFLRDVDTTPILMKESDLFSV